MQNTGKQNIEKFREIATTQKLCYCFEFSFIFTNFNCPENIQPYKVIVFQVTIQKFAFISSYCSIDICSEKMASNLPNIQVTEDLESSDFDAIVVVAPSIKSIPFEKVANPLKAYIEVDKSGESGIFVVPSNLPSKKIVFSGTGSLDNDYDDVSHYTKAAKNGIKKALATGSKSPLLLFNATRFPEAGTVALLGALEALYVPIEVREQVPEKAVKVAKLGLFGNAQKIAEKLDLAKALEAGRIVSRDIGGSDPERMAAPAVEEYVRQEFEGSNIKIEVVKGQAMFEQEYPCFAAVNRCASQVERHDGRIIWLTYEPEGPIEKTLMLVGKGINYDTGGADIKAGGTTFGFLKQIFR